jgi:ABC-type amino acid transport substrate-binding protein
MLKIFLAHASEDKEQIIELFYKLKQSGFDPWLDEFSLLPGQNWRVEIPKAIRQCDIFVACLSKHSVNKQGYVQREFRLALSAYAEKPIENIYLIPLKLDDSEVPELQIPQLGINLRDIHWLDYWKPNGFGQLLRAIHPETSDEIDSISSDDDELTKQPVVEEHSGDNVRRIWKKTFMFIVLMAIGLVLLFAKTLGWFDRKTATPELILTQLKISQMALSPTLTPSITETHAITSTNTSTPTHTHSPTLTFTLTPNPAPTHSNTPRSTNTKTPVAFSKREESFIIGGIVDRNFIRIGIRSETLWPFLIVEENQYSGFEIDLAKEIVERLFGDQVFIEWVPLSAAERFPYLQSGAIDFLIRQTTHTLSREQYGLWTTSYFLDGTRFLVHRNSGIYEIDDLGGRTISVMQGTNTKIILDDWCIREEIDCATLEIDGLFSDVFNAFFSEKADAVISDWSYLLHYSHGDPTYQVIGEIVSTYNNGMEIGRDPLAIGVNLDDPNFRDIVDDTLLVIIADGTWQKIYDLWFPDPPPWTIYEMIEALPADR